MQAVIRFSPLLLLATVQHVNHLEDFISLEVIHLFERLYVLRNVREPAYRHRHVGLRCVCIGIIR